MSLGSESDSQIAGPTPANLPPLSARQLEPRSDNDVEQDAVYGLVSVLYHALRDASACRKYVSDGRAANNPELERFFEQCRSIDAERVSMAKRLLSPLIADAAGSADGAAASGATAAAFAPGDGADDADISPSGERGKVGNWPAL